MKEFKPITVESLKLSAQEKKKISEGAQKVWPVIDEIYGDDKRSSDSSDEQSRSE